jgi:hypothetical protein
MKKIKIKQVFYDEWCKVISDIPRKFQNHPFYSRAPDKLRICIFYAMKTSKNACIIRSECTLIKQVFYDEWCKVILSLYNDEKCEI